MFGILLFVFGIGITLWAQYKVKSNFRHYLEVPVYSGMIGAQVARLILDRNGLTDVDVEMVPGSLSDHYDPRTRTVRLSEPVYQTSSISAISVAAHECGHAVQHKEQYGALMLRHRMVPVLNIASGLATPLLLAGFLFRTTGFILLGIIFFAATVVFHLVTLPVEFNASSRAKTILLREGIIRSEEERGVQDVLGAAAFTYVAGALVALLELLRLLLIFFYSSRDE